MKGMNIGCTVTLSDYSIADRAGFDFIEISGRNVVALDERGFRDLRKKIQDGRLSCKGFNAYCPKEIVIAGPGFSLSRAKEFAKRSRDRAALLGIHHVGIGSPFSRSLPIGFNRELAFQQATSFFEATADIFAEVGVIVCVEALAKCYCNFINTVSEAVQIVRVVNRINFKAVIDFYNMEMEGEADQDLLPFVQEIAHVHISDDAGNPTRRWFLKKEKGNLHVERVRKLLNNGYSGDITLEVDLPLTMGAARQSLEVLRSVSVS